MTIPPYQETERNTSCVKRIADQAARPIYFFEEEAISRGANNAVLLFDFSRLEVALALFNNDFFARHDALRTMAYRVGAEARLK